MLLEGNCPVSKGWLSTGHCSLPTGLLSKGMLLEVSCPVPMGWLSTGHCPLPPGLLSKGTLSSGSCPFSTGYDASGAQYFSPVLTTSTHSDPSGQPYPRKPQVVGSISTDCEPVMMNAASSTVQCKRYWRLIGTAGQISNFSKRDFVVHKLLRSYLGYKNTIDSRICDSNERHHSTGGPVYSTEISNCMTHNLKYDSNWLLICFAQHGSV
jgi:hypothetical protein